MKVLQKLLLVAALACGVIVFNGTTATAQGNEESVQEQTETAEQENVNTGSYEYTAKSGDSYTVLARKAIQTYGIVNSVELSPAQIIYAETNLTLEADSPLLNVREEVSIDGNLVEAWVKKAQNLNPKAEKMWQPYVADVDFDTSNNG